MPATTRPDRAARIALAALLLASGITNIAYTMFIPLVPHLTDRLGMSAAAVAAAFGGFALAKALAQPLGGFLVDRARQPSRLACAGLLLTAVMIGALALARSGTQVVAWRLAWGAAEGLTIPLLYRLVTALGRVTGLGTARAMGRFGAAAVSGMAAGPALVGLLYLHIGYTRVFLLGALLTVVSGLLLLLAPTAAIQEEAEADGQAAAPLRAGVLLALVAVFGAVDLANNAVYAALEPVIPLHLARTAGPSSVGLTSWLFTGGLAVFAAVSALCGRLLDRTPSLVTAAVAFTVAGLALLLLGLVGGPVAFTAGFLLFMATQPVVYVAARNGLSALPRRQLGRAFGLFGPLSDTGFIAGPAIGVALYEAHGAGVFLALGTAAFVVVGGCVALRRLPDRRVAAAAIQTARPEVRT